MKRLVALFVAAAFVTGVTGSAVAQQAQTPPPAAEKKAEKTAEKKASPKNVNGTVKSAGAGSIVVAGKEKGKDAEWTFAVDAKTKIKKGGKDITAKDLAAGDNVHVRYMDHEGKAMASAITVRPAKKAETAKKEEPKKEEKK